MKQLLLFLWFMVPKKREKKIYNIKPTDQSLKKVIRLLWSSISSSVIGVTIMADTLVLRTK